MGETEDPGMNVGDLKQKLMQSNAYLDGEEFVKDFLDTTIEERMEGEERRKREEEQREKYREEIEELRKRAEERRLGREQELEFVKIEARQKTERN
ncbi:hypothetical protein TNIN_73301 [Trichonephila inaurata madagascariensis]|uniref:Uncharacterized protein n=1 Tax=Trichonephila inaurata madagascariensis TaxID=2747483 RepID=A0A8X7CLY0_9ARAC|nr:hypothetical protein TNIN_73301 [Trichonephila inaurata madagascariensis]